MAIIQERGTIVVPEKNNLEINFKDLQAVAVWYADYINYEKMQRVWFCYM